MWCLLESFFSLIKLKFPFTTLQSFSIFASYYANIWIRKKRKEHKQQHVNNNETLWTTESMREDGKNLLFVLALYDDIILKVRVESNYMKQQKHILKGKGENATKVSFVLICFLTTFINGLRTECLMSNGSFKKNFCSNISVWFSNSRIPWKKKISHIKKISHKMLFWHEF